MNRVLLGFGLVLAVVAVAAMVFDDAPRRVVVNLPDGARYEGGFRDDEFDGEGVYTFADGRELAGEFRAGVFHGEGRCLNRALGYPCPGSRADEARRRAGVSA